MKGKGKAYRFIDGGRGGKGIERMRRGTGNTGEGEGKAREESKVKRSGKEKRK